MRSKNILIQLSHPAHFHLYKNVAANLINDGYKVFIIIKTKDILEDLLKESWLPYYNILKVPHRRSKLGVLMDTFIRDWRMMRFVKQNDIDLLTGSTVEVAHVGWLMRKDSINTGEDDLAVVPQFGYIAGPFVKCHLAPLSCDVGFLTKKCYKYAGYHELAYLHPNHFMPDREVVEKYFPTNTPYYLIRFSNLKAFHDNGITGINSDIAQNLIEILKPHGRIYITSERALESQFEQYCIKINPLDIHHVMAFASLYIGDSQTMAAEAAVLGVPFIRYNDFVGRIGYLNELENVYHLGFGIKASEEGSADKMYKTLTDLLSMPDLKEEWQKRRQKMLSEKIDYAKFLTWFIENYPESAKIMKQNPDYQLKFK